ncbi:hypothetical protein [Capnocytophaga felis]|nr:hypothetical protein [Capnocytophaga felis]
MKRNFLLFVLLLTIMSCNKSPSEEVQPKIEEKLSFSMGIRESVNVTNFRVGSHIPVDVTEIVDSHKGNDFIYQLRVVGNDATRHQVLGVDYDMRVKEGSVFKDVASFEITDISKMPSFVIIPKVPGTFQLDFYLQKYDKTNQRNVGEPIAKQLIFSAVKINFSFPATEVREADFWNHSVHRREFKFSIDDGNREYDTYLSNLSSSKRYEYYTSYDGQVRQGEFVQGQWYEFRDSIERKKGPTPIQEMPQTITIYITQYLNNGLKNIIKYENVQLEY